ncbi:MAG TPA: EAL domain-containing protein [Terracidiphilus sp.]|nr:EAL domain-containing protein [Terracidiphilus sp.]
MSSLLRTLRAAAAAGGIMLVLQLVRSFLFPDLPNWVSFSGRILFTILVVAITGFILLRKEELLRMRMADSENRYRLLFERSPVGKYRATLSGRILDCNESFARIFAYGSREHMIGTSVIPLYFSNAERSAFIEKLLAKHELTNFEHRLRRCDGSTVTVLNNACLVAGDGAEPVIEGTVTDISQLREAEEALRASETQYRILFEKNPIPMWVFDRKSLRFLAVNAAAVQQYGYSEQEFLDRTVVDIHPEEAVSGLLQRIAGHEDGLERPGLGKHRKKDGTVIDVELVCDDLDFRGHEGMLVAINDLTPRNKAQEAARNAEAKYRAIFDNAVIGIFQHAPDGRPVSINRAFAAMHGYGSPEELMAEITNVAAQLFVDPPRMMEVAEASAAQGVVRGAEVELYRKDRSRFWVRVNLRAVRDPTGNIALFEGTAEDISDRKAAEAQVEYLAYFDALTGLPNRTLLKDRLENALAAARRRNELVALLFLDLDRFKIVNDSLGHSIGDLMLKDVAERLKACVRKQDTVARVGGDEFVVVLSSVKDSTDAAAAAQRIIEAMATRFEIQDYSLSATCSLGISVFPQNGADGEALLKFADQAMYSAKENGRNHFRFFTDDLDRRAVDRLNLENDLRRALERNEFFLVYQPKMKLANGEFTGFEALIRWQHPERGLVPPDRFIPIAENSGLILPIGEWALRTACRQARNWQCQGAPAVPVAVNVSAVQFRQDGFCDLIQQALLDTGLAPQFLELELTESVLLSTADAPHSILGKLKEMGVKLAIDDFGTGYSNLGYLRRFKVDRLKIDRSFTRDIAANREDASIASGMISLAKSLNLTVVAEGIENEPQLAFLREHGCDEIQGFYVCRPLPADRVVAALKSASLRQRAGTPAAV